MRFIAQAGGDAHYWHRVGEMVAEHGGAVAAVRQKMPNRGRVRCLPRVHIASGTAPLRIRVGSITGRRLDREVIEGVCS